MTIQESRPRIEVNSGTIDQGNRICKTAVKTCFADYAWVVNNLPGDRRTALYALLNHVVRAADYLDLESTNGLPLDVWCEFRDDLSDAFMEKYASADLVALVDACKKFNVQRQYLFDILIGVDSWIRDRRIETFDDLLVFTYRFGGAALAASVPIIGFVKPDYEVPAINAGQAILLTQILANLVQDIKLKKTFIAVEDLEETELSIPRVKVRQTCSGLKHLIRLYGHRIEKLMYKGGRLIEYLDFDAKRSFTSLYAIHWEMLMRMRLEPDVVLSKAGVLSRGELFKLKTRHIMGIEGNIPVIPAIDPDH